MKRQARNGDDFYGFLGLPFALPPIGAFRWQPPQAPPKWDGTMDATKQPNACAQDGIFKVSPVSCELFERIEIMLLLQKFIHPTAQL